MQRLLPLLLVALTACGGEEPLSETGSHQAPITDGVTDNGHAAVGMLELVVPMPDDPTQLGYSLCTGTLVGQRTVLTAAHCVEDLHDASFQVGGKVYQAASWQAHPQYAPANDIFKFDIAVVLLKESPPITPHAVASRPPTQGTTITLVGFGETGKNVGDFGTKRKATNTVAGLNTHEFNVKGTGGGVGNICHGDSGGPAFVQESGAEILYGINSRGDAAYPNACGVSEYESRVDVALPWLRQVTGGDIEVTDHQVNVADSTPPQVQILSPIPNATISTMLSVTTQVSDDGQLSTVSLRVDGVEMGVLQQGPYAFQVQLTPGAHQIQVVARDAAGNEGQASVNVYSSDTGAAAQQQPPAAAQQPTAATNNTTPEMIVGGCSVGASAGGAGWALALLALLFVCRRRR